MPTPLNKDEHRYLNLAKKMSLSDIYKSYDKDLLLDRLKEKIRNSDILSIERGLQYRNFILPTSIAGKYQISDKGNAYLNWKKKRKRGFLKRKFLELVSNQHLHHVSAASLLFFLFLVVNQIYYEFYKTQHVEQVLNNAVTAFSKATGIIKITFCILVALYSFLHIRRRIGVGDYFLFIVYLFFRFFPSQWHFQDIFYINRIDILYIDAIAFFYFCQLAFFIYEKTKKQSQHSSTTYLAQDLPLKELSLNLNKDIDTVDQLGRLKFAQQIADELVEFRPYRAFAIGINGPWGSGKTSLIDLIIQRIKEDDFNESLVVVEFMPWLAKDTESLVKQFFNLLENAFSNNKTLVRELKSYVRAVSAIEKRIFDTEILTIWNSQAIEIKDQYDTIIDEIKREAKVVVIKIDDLDRLANNEILDTLKLIRVVANFPNTIYIVGYDKAYLTSAIKASLTEHKPEKFTDKIFNVEFSIPKMSERIILDRLKQNLKIRINKLIIKEKITASQNIDVDNFLDKFFYHDIDRFIENERDILRFTNNLLMRYVSIKEDVNFEDFFYLELIHYRYPDIYSEIYQSKEKLTN